MISFDEGEFRFNYRIAGVAVDDGRVLLEKVEGQDFWFLPGGRAEMMETSAETLKREMREEIGTEVEVDRLLWVAENFFSGDDPVGKRFITNHELGLYFLMRLDESSPLLRQPGFTGEDDGLRVTFRWHTLEEIGKISVYPPFLGEGLVNLPAAPVHIVNRAAASGLEM